MPDTSPTDPADAATRVYVDHRELLFSIVYTMLGSVADTEDVLQETWLSWTSRHQVAGTEIEHPRAYLVRIAVNQALARQSAMKRRRETYVGPWLPEPLVTASGEAAPDSSDTATQTEAVSMALMVVLETLSPAERVVFVLHEVFGYAHTEIADILDRTPAAVRQLAHRAREHVQSRRPRFQADPRLQRQVTERFIAAALGGDLDALMSLLAPDVTMWSDGGGKVRTAGLRPVRGRDKVTRLLSGYAARRPEELDIRFPQVNGVPSVLVHVGGVPYLVLVLDLTPRGDQVCGIYAVANPDKLAHIP